jgi:hypothetical protein
MPSALVNDEMSSQPSVVQKCGWSSAFWAALKAFIPELQDLRHPSHLKSDATKAPQATMANVVTM